MSLYTPEKRNGFTLVELMIVVSIVAILSSVAIPSYINHINRVKQSEATNQLLAARIELEEFYADNGRYASTIACLPTFSSDTSCIRNCGACASTSYKSKYYSYKITNAANNYYKVSATRKIYSYAPDDSIYVSSNTDTPVVTNESALAFSIFKWLFN